MCTHTAQLWKHSVRAISYSQMCEVYEDITGAWGNSRPGVLPLAKGGRFERHEQRERVWFLILGPTSTTFSAEYTCCDLIRRRLLLGCFLRINAPGKVFG